MTDQVCALCDDRPHVTVCDACGRVVCSDCSDEQDSEIVCDECLDRRGRRR